MVTEILADTTNDSGVFVYLTKNLTACKNIQKSFEEHT